MTLLATAQDVLDGRSEWSLTCADCLGPNGLSGLPDRSVAHVIGDPPYSKHVHGNARTNKKRGELADADRRQTAGAHEIAFDHLSDAVRESVADHAERLATRWVLLFCEQEGTGEWRGELTASGLEYIRTGQWIRLGSMPQVTGDRPAAGSEAIVIAHPFGRKRWNGGGRPAVWSHVIAGKDCVRHHPTEKPLDLMLALITDFTDPGDIVLDPFAGSGTTGVACIRLGRRFIGFERDEKHAATAVKRLSAARRQEGLFDRVRAPKAKQLQLGGAK